MTLFTKINTNFIKKRFDNFVKQKIRSTFVDENVKL